MQRANTRVLNLEGSEYREQGKNSAWEQLRLYPIPKAILYLYDMTKGVVTCRNPILVTGFSPQQSRPLLFRKKAGSQGRLRRAPETLPENRCRRYATWTTSLTAGICSFSIFSTPIFIVMVDMGQEPQAPLSRTFTTPLCIYAHEFDIAPVPLEHGPYFFECLFNLLFHDLSPSSDMASSCSFHIL